MANLTLSQIFGSNVIFSPSDRPGALPKLELNLTDYQNEDNSGDIKNGLGFSDVYLIRPETKDDYSVGLFYAMMLLIMQNQAENKDDDIEQKIHITSSSARITSFGNRKGQLERRFTISIFSDGKFENTTSVDNI